MQTIDTIEYICELEGEIMVDSKKEVVDGTNKIVSMITDETIWVNIGFGILKIVVILIGAMIALKVIKLAIINFFKVREKSPLRTNARRDDTLSHLLVNVSMYVVYFVALIMILDTLTVKVGAILAGAGIMGLAVGFGAQSLVKDIITGFFIIFEDQFSVGDYVRIDALEGSVLAIGLRTTKLKSFTGEMHVIPNGMINQVTNFSIHNSVAIIDMSIANDNDVDKVGILIADKILTFEHEDMVTKPQFLGVQNITAAETILRVICETKPMQHGIVARIIRKELKMYLDEFGISTPVQKLVLHNQEEKKQVREEGSI